MGFNSGFKVLKKAEETLLQAMSQNVPVRTT